MSDTPPLTADEVRSRLTANFQAAKEILAGFYDYAQRAGALAQEYHRARLRETYPQACFDELVLVCSLDARETPKSLDNKLMELAAANIKIEAVIFDQVKFTYHLFTCTPTSSPTSA